MSDLKLYTLDGHQPVRCDHLMWWARWFESADRTVAKTTIGSVLVSTVFLGLDHSWRDGDSPELFETMAFNADGADFAMERYATWEEAEAGHAAMVATVERFHKDKAKNIGGAAA